MLRLLLADDEPELRQIFALTLRKHGHSVDECARADDAMGRAIASRMNNREFDGLILDLAMPEMSGFDLLEKVRENGVLAPCLFVTAHCDDFGRARAHAAGALVFDKPVILAELVGAVEAMVQGTPCVTVPAVLMEEPIP